MTETEVQSRPADAGDVPKPCSQQIELEELCKLRYTSEDEDYMKTENTPLAPPPCIENWYSKPKRTYDWSRDGQPHRGHGHHGNWRGQNRGNRGGNHHGNYRRHEGDHQGYRDRSDHRQARDHGHHGYDRRSNDYGNQGHNHSYERHGNRERGGEGRVNYAGMKQPDGRNDRRQHTGSHPYRRDMDKHWT